MYHAPFDVRLTTGGANGDQQIQTVVQPDICVATRPGSTTAATWEPRTGSSKSGRPATPRTTHLPTEPTDAQVDSVLRKDGDPTDYFHRLVVRRAACWVHSTREEVVHQVLRGGSIMLFLLTPLAALLLKGAYFCQHRYYLSHLVFTIHVQCFLFIFLSLLIGMDKLLTLPEWLDNLLLLVPAVYFIVALHTFYQQSWRKMVVKSLLLGAAYSFTALLSLLTVGAIGVALF